MSDVYEKVGEKVGNNIQREVRDAVKEVEKSFVDKFEKIGFRKEDVAPHIKKGIQEAGK